jgi:hypothetical protein
VGHTDPSIALTVVSLAAAAVASGAIIVTLARVGWLTTPHSDRLVHIGNWLVLAWPAIGTLNPLTTWGQRAVTLPLAIAALVVARSHPPPHAGKAPRPSVTRTPSLTEPLEPGMDLGARTQTGNLAKRRLRRGP